MHKMYYTFMSIKEMEKLLELLEKLESIERRLSDIERELNSIPKYVPVYPYPTVQPILPNPTYPYIIYTVTSSASGTAPYDSSIEP